MKKIIAQCLWDDLLFEAAYPGNMGAMEMVKFYQVATKKQEKEMDDLLDKNKTRKAWDLLKHVTGVKLRNPGSTWDPRGKKRK